MVARWSFRHLNSTPHLPHSTPSPLYDLVIMVLSLCRPPGSNAPKWFKFDDGDVSEAKLDDEEVLYFACLNVLRSISSSTCVCCHVCTTFATSHYCTIIVCVCVCVSFIIIGIQVTMLWWRLYWRGL